MVTLFVLYKHERYRCRQTSLSDSLVDLGLTRPEADAYLQLLTLAADGPAATGYQVAKQLGKDPTSVYRALEALRQRGAVETVAGRGRMYRPVAPDELVRLLKRDFWARSVRAREQLAALATAADDAEIYRLATRDQALERFGQLLDDCAEIALLDLAAPMHAHFAPRLEAARARGVEVVVVATDHGPRSRPEGSLRPDEADHGDPGRAARARADRGVLVGLRGAGEVGPRGPGAGGARTGRLRTVAVIVRRRTVRSYIIDIQ